MGVISIWLLTLDEKPVWTAYQEDIFCYCRYHGNYTGFLQIHNNTFKCCVVMGDHVMAEDIIKDIIELIGLVTGESWLLIVLLQYINHSFLQPFFSSPLVPKISAAALTTCKIGTSDEFWKRCFFVRIIDALSIDELVGLYKKHLACQWCFYHH